MKRHAQLVQFQEQGQEQKEDEDEEGPDAEWDEESNTAGGLVQVYISRGRLCFKESVYQDSNQYYGDQSFSYLSQG